MDHLELYDAKAEEEAAANGDDEPICAYSLLLSDREAADLAAALTNRLHEGGA